jgi:all-trans-retinol dehydrogenase (NAD+)
MRSVEGKRVLVTGGAMGMGRLFCERAIAEQAAAVVLWDVNEDALNATLTGLTELASGVTEVSGYIVDVADAEAIADTAAAVLDEVGPIDVLINNAGVVRGNKYFWETDLERDTKFTIDVNTLAPMYVAHQFLPAMIAAPGECRLLNLASAAGFTPNPRMAVYAASKWAVIGWSDSVRLELKQAGLGHIKVTTVCPYYVRTGMFEGAKSAPLLPLLDPAEVVEEAWTAMLAGRPFVVLPKTVMLSEMLKGVIPTGVRDFIADHIIGVYHTMDDFTGRAEPTSERRAEKPARPARSR